MDQVISKRDQFYLHTLGYTAGGYLAMGSQGVIANGNCNESAIRYALVPDDPDLWHYSNHYSRSGLRTEAQPLDYRGKRCAIKILDAEQMFLNEARIMSRLRHRNIVQLYEAIIVDNKSLYIIMEASDATLEDFIGKCLNEGLLARELEAINMVKDLLSGLRYLHDMRHCHCDIHVGNVMSFTDANLNTIYKYIDFGSAVSANDHPTHVYQRCVLIDIQRFAGVMNNIYRITNFENVQFQQYMNNYSNVINREDVTLHQLIDGFRSITRDGCYGWQ